MEQVTPDIYSSHLHPMSLVYVYTSIGEWNMLQTHFRDSQTIKKSV